jgi:NAD(P)-dependent dehydrogenase (short-subunit alcohol dehydrogenase family)
MFNLDGRVAVVTGAARGIGFAIGRTLIRAGATVTFSDIDAKGLEAAADRLHQEIPVASGRAFFAVADIADPAQASALVDTVHRRKGRLDIAVNNAGLGDVSEFLDLDVAKLRRVMDVNLFGPFVLAQAAARLMRLAGYGRIINVASISGVRAGWARTAYGTSKAALIHLTKQIAMEVGQYGITANAILPGPIDTDLARTMHTAETRAAYIDSVPVGRYGNEDDVATAALFLASDEAAYINGLEVAVDGGFLAGGIKVTDIATKQTKA